eukprot:4239534-Amphidinium_carterae.1
MMFHGGHFDTGAALLVKSPFDMVQVFGGLDICFETIQEEYSMASSSSATMRCILARQCKYQCYHLGKFPGTFSRLFIAVFLYEKVLDPFCNATRTP